MQIRCPVCDYSREIDISKIPPTAEFATCPKCRHRFRFRALDLDAIEKPAPPEPKPEHADVWDAVDSLQDAWRQNDAHETESGNEHSDQNGEPQREVAVPWENPRYLGYWQSFVRTTMWVILQPSSFFAVLSRRPALLPALAYYLILGMFQYVLNVVWTQMAGSMMQERLIEVFGEERYREAIGNVLENSLFSPAILTVPFLLAMQLAITTMVIHIIIRLMEPQRADFAVAFKIVSYASASLLLTIVPVAGALLAPVWYVALLLLGCRSAFNLTWGKAMLAMTPLYVLMFLAASSQYTHFLSL
ncbi:MAG: hypothetical protein DELT_01109 [Desulfovibrio sp.]